MGKGKRARIERQNAVDPKAAEKAQALKTQKTNKLLGGIVGVIVALLLVFGIVISAVSASGVFLRGATAASSANFSVDGTMMSYFLKSNYYTFVNQMGDYLSYFNLDTSLPLKTQSYSDTQTWFTYFADQAKTSVEELLVLCEAANAAGMSIQDEEVQTIVDNYMESLKNNAKENGMSKKQYIANVYGEGVKEKDLRAAIEISALASVYQEQVLASFTYTDADLEAYYSENENSFKTVDYKSYTYYSTIPEGSSDEVTAEINAVTKAKADALAANTTPSSFDAYLLDELTTDATTEEDAVKNEETVAATLTEGAAYIEGDAAMEWAFDASRKVNDTYVAEGDNSYTVYLLTSTAARDDSLTKNVRHILIYTTDYESAEAAKAEADRILAEWQAGDKTEDSFAALAEQYSGDTGSNTNGGLYENVRGGDMVETFDAWLFDSARAAGDTGVIESEYGYHVMYFVGDGKIAWKADVESAKLSEDYEAAYAAEAEKYTVTFDDNAINKIDA
ncbi:MAG: peptidylprolyl isomerase [Clostridia bacterium]|nr:peptidylprolyl isomerase [Clostridia bacterium]